MKTAKILAVLGIMIMAGAILYAMIYGDFRQEGRMILSIPWGIVSLVDLYIGFFLFSGWIVYRETSRWHSIVWIVLLMFLGFLIGAIYVFIALQTSKGSWGKFWMGKQWNKERIAG
jgi:hypothetical protein